MRRGVALAPLTTFGVGGEAELFAECATEEDVVEALGLSRRAGLAVTVLGGGSNVLVADRGVRGLVLRVRVRGRKAVHEGGGVRVEAGAGEPWDELVAHAVENDWAGVECLSGIPGDVGATPIQNVGAYGQEVAETIVEVRAIERATGSVRVFDREGCGFGYRDSVFKRGARDAYVVVRVTFALRVGGAPKVAYAELEKRLGGTPKPSLRDVREAVVALRRGKSMVLDPADENGRSAGSFFMNPTLGPEALGEALRRIGAAGVVGAGERVPQFPAEGGKTKLSAGWLIERAGFSKGTRRGNVGLSTKHALAVVARGAATAAEVVEFAAGVRRGVRERFGVVLQPEPVMVGFERGEVEALVG